MSTRGGRASAGAIWIVCLALGLGPSGVAAADDSRVTLTHPRSSWSLILDLPGFKIGPPKIFHDGTQVWFEADHRPTGLMLTAFVEETKHGRDAESCRKYYLKKVSRPEIKRSNSTRGDLALSEYLVEAHEGERIDHKHLNAYLGRDGFCADLHISKMHFAPDDRGLFDAVLDTVTIAPAADDERQRAARYLPSGGPGGDLLIQALSHVKDKDFEAADALLGGLCPWPGGRPITKNLDKNPPCQTRAFVFAEVRGITKGKDLALSYWLLGDRERQAKHWDEAQAFMEVSVDRNPGDPQTWYWLGQVLREKQDPEAAVSAFRKALDLDPKDATTMYWLATSLMDLGKLDEADAMLDRVAATDSKEVRVWFRRGQIQMKRGAYEEAVAAFEKAKSFGVDAKRVEEEIESCRKAMAAQRPPGTGETPAPNPRR